MEKQKGILKIVLIGCQISYVQFATYQNTVKFGLPGK
jgi:hypothetical protein